MAGVNGHHLNVIFPDDIAVNLADTGPNPVAVLDHCALSKCKFTGGVINALAAKHCLRGDGIVKVQVENILVLVGIFKSNFLHVFCNVRIIFLKLIGNRDVGQMSLPAPVLAALQ